MEWLHELWRRLVFFLRRGRFHRDLQEEIRLHQDLRAQSHAEDGMMPEEAHYAARREFGNTLLLRERSRNIWDFAWLETLFQDVRYGTRQLRRNPGFTAVAILTLALGIGASTAIFSLTDAVMLRSMPVREPSQLVLFRWEAHHALPRNGEYSGFGDCPAIRSGTNPSGCSFPLPVFGQMQSETKAFSGVIAFAGPAQLDLSGNGPPSIASGELVSGNYFSVLGVGAVLGRTIGLNDDTWTASPAAVLSYAYWQSAFGGEKSAVGRTIILNNIPFTIIGVAEPSFDNPSPGKTQDFWLPIAMLPRLGISWGHRIKDMSNWWLVMLGRLKNGVSRRQAQAAASLLFRDEMLHGAKSLSKPEDDPAITLVPAQEGLTGERGHFSRPLYTLMFAVSLILLIACANVGGLLLARAAARSKEMAVRLSVGATRGRVLRQLLTESVVLSVSGGALGVIFAYWGVHVAEGLMSSNSQFPFIIAPDWRVLLFTVSVSLFTGILFGLAPAFSSSRVDLTPALKDNESSAGRNPARRRLSLANILVVGQVGLSLVVLLGAGLLVRTLKNLREIDPGFDTQNLLLFGIDPTLSGYKAPQIQNLYRELQTRLAALPGVISSSYSSDALLIGDLWTREVHVEGQPQRKTVEVDMLTTGPSFFHTLRIPLLEGRTFTAEDFEQTANAVPEGAGGRPRSPAPVAPPIPVLVNATFARRYLAKVNPLGKRIDNGHGDSASGDLTTAKPRSGGFVIVGVVGDAKYSTLRRAIHPTVYVPLYGGGAYFELRTAANPASLIPTVRRAANQVDSRLPLFDVHTQIQKIDELLVNERMVARLASFFGALAVLLACVGLYGLLSYEVTRRTRELGIRMALGAQRQDVLRLVVGQGMTLTVIGVTVGVIAALGLTRFLSSLLYGVKPTDPLTFVIVALLLTAVALLACYIPARRATKVDPMVALRYE